MHPGGERVEQSAHKHIRPIRVQGAQYLRAPPPEAGPCTPGQAVGAGHAVSAAADVVAGAGRTEAEELIEGSGEIDGSGRKCSGALPGR